jgi:hypothetical protein
LLPWLAQVTILPVWCWPTSIDALLQVLVSADVGMIIKIEHGAWIELVLLLQLQASVLRQGSGERVCVVVLVSG